MLSMTRYEGESNMVLEDKDVALDLFKMVQASVEDRDVQVLKAFNESKYARECLHIGRFLRSMTTDASWMEEQRK